MEVLGSDDTYELFKVISEKGSIDSQVLESRSGITKAQYYKRIQKLMACGLVTRKSKKLSLSSFGHAINDTRLKVETIVKEYHRLKAFDLVMNLKGMGKKEQTDLLDELIKNTDIKSILMENLNSLAA